MEQIAVKSHQNRAFKLLSLATNGLFLFHLSFSLTLIFFIFSKQEPPHYYYKLLELLLTKSYMIVYCATDLGLFILLKYKQRKNLIQGTDYGSPPCWVLSTSLL